MPFLIACLAKTSPSKAALAVLVSFFIISPFFLVGLGKLNISYAYYASLGLLGGILFSLGSFTGKIAEENRLKQGILMLFAGIVIGLLFYSFMLFGLL